MNRVGIDLEEAVALILQHGQEIKKSETISLIKANGRILAEDIYAPMNNPPFDRSPLDGFALRSSDSVGATKEMPKCLTIIDTVYAGGFCNKEIQTGETVRIMTGAPIPKGADCVIRQEDTSFSSDEINQKVYIEKDLRHHQNYCFQGEDIAQGTLLIEKGTRLSYIEQGIMASVGLAQILVWQKPRVALYVTGDEVIAPGSMLQPGKIYDSNLQLLYSRLQEFGVETEYADYLPDDPEQVADAIKKAAKNADLIITTGGVSVGTKDIFHEVLPLLGIERIFWGVNLKPGTPAMFSLVQGVPLLSLSGNPFAAVTTFELLGRPLLAKISRNTDLYTTGTRGTLAEPFAKPSGARRFLRGNIINGQVYIPPTEQHASGILASMAGCNCLVDIKAGSGQLEKGHPVDVILLNFS